MSAIPFGLVGAVWGHLIMGMDLTILSMWDTYRTVHSWFALAFPEHPDAQEWLDFAIEENAYLWGPDGHYLMPDGGISEGPLYFHFGVSAAIPFFIAVENSRDADALYTKSCINRQDVDSLLSMLRPD